MWYGSWRSVSVIACDVPAAEASVGPLLMLEKTSVMSEAACGWCRTPLSLSGLMLWGWVYHQVILLAAKPVVTRVKRAVWGLWICSWWPRAAVGADCCSGLTALKSAFSLSIQAGGKGKKAECLLCGIRGNPTGRNSWLLNPMCGCTRLKEAACSHVKALEILDSVLRGAWGVSARGVRGAVCHMCHVNAYPRSSHQPKRVHMAAWKHKASALGVCLMAQQGKNCFPWKGSN